jgi:6-phosphogluconolactonase
MPGFNDAQKQIFPDAEALAAGAAAWLTGLAKDSEGVFRVSLSGGSTPKRLYELLATRFLEVFPWNRVHWYFGDERYVAAADEKSNYRMVEQAMFSHAPIPRDNIHRVITESETPDIAAGRYQAGLQRVYGSQVLDKARPLFDVMLLGLGEDAHTASIFPGNKAMKEQDAWVVSVPDGTPPTRITMTYPVLNSARHAAFLIAGEGKKPALERVVRGDKSAPAAHIAPVGMLHFLIDEAAKVTGF